MNAQEYLLQKSSLTTGTAWDHLISAIRGSPVLPLEEEPPVGPTRTVNLLGSLEVTVTAPIEVQVADYISVTAPIEVQVADYMSVTVCSSK